MTTQANVMSQYEREKAIARARRALRKCQTERDSFMLKYPDHSEAKRVYNARGKVLNADLDRLLRGGA